MHGYDAAGNRTDSGAELVAGHRLVAFDGFTLGRRIGVEGPAGTRELLHGGQNLVAELDGAGDVVNTYRYGPRGAEESATEGVPDPFRFTARE